MNYELKPGFWKTIAAFGAVFLVIGIALLFWGNTGPGAIACISAVVLGVFAVIQKKKEETREK